MTFWEWVKAFVYCLRHGHDWKDTFTTSRGTISQDCQRCNAWRLKYPEETINES